jgi:hypothetical protein
LIRKRQSSRYMYPLKTQLEVSAGVNKKKVKLSP